MSLDLTTFVRATGGGEGNYEPSNNKKRAAQCGPKAVRFCQVERCKEVQVAGRTQGLGFGRISFDFAPLDPKLYLRIPKESDPKMAILFVETVWNLPRPKLVMNITGGAMDFHISTELQNVLNDLMEISRNTNAWIITGGTRAGIMKYFGAYHSSISFFLGRGVTFSGRPCAFSIRREHSSYRYYNTWLCFGK